MAPIIHKKWTPSSPNIGCEKSGRLGIGRVYKIGMPKYARTGPKRDMEKARKRLLKRQIGKRLEQVRLELGYKIAADLADILEVERGTYNNYERGTTFIPASTLVVLATLDVSIEYLLLGLGEPLYEIGLVAEQLATIKRSAASV